MAGDVGGGVHGDNEGPAGPALVIGTRGPPMDGRLLTLHGGSATVDLVIDHEGLVTTTSHSSRPLVGSLTNNNLSRLKVRTRGPWPHGQLTLQSRDYWVSEEEWGRKDSGT